MTNAPNTVTLPPGLFPPPPPQRHVMGPKNQKPMQARARSFDASLRALSSDRPPDDRQVQAFFVVR